MYGIYINVSINGENEEVKSGLQWWLSKVTVMAAVSIAQAVIMVAVLMGINGLEPHYVGKHLEWPSWHPWHLCH